MFSTKRLAVRIALLCASVGAYADGAPTPHLSLDEVDQAARDSVMRQLKGDWSAPKPSSAPAATPKADPAPVPKLVDESTQQRVEPVRFVGAFSDAASSSVLYEYRGAVYPARVGSRLLNGVSVKKVDGYQVTVTNGKRTWTEPMTGSSPPRETGPTSGLGGPLRSIADLGSPLPPGVMPGSVAVPLGR
jgi:hypothetical protein